MWAPQAGVCVLVWALGAPPVARVARVALRRCEGRLRSGTLASPAARPLGGLSGSAIRVLRARVCGRGGPALSVPLACLPCGGLHAAGVEGGRPWGVRRPPSPVPRGMGPGLRGPCFPGAVVVGLGIQHRPLSLHVLSWSRRCMLWGQRKGAPGGVPCAVARGVWIQALSLPRPATHVLSVGAQHCPLVLHAPRGATCRWGGGWPSQGGWPSTVLGGVWRQALSLPRPVDLQGVGGEGSVTRVSLVWLVWAWGPRVPVADVRGVRIQALSLPGRPAVGAGVQVRGPSTVPVTCVPCGCLRAAGMVGGRPWGGWPSTVVGGVWCQAPSLPRLPVLGWVGSRVAAICVSRVRLVWARDPALSPWLACPGGGCEPRGCWKAVPRGGWPSTVVRGVWCQALSVPRPPVLRGGQPGLPFVRSVCPGCGWYGRGDPAPAPERALVGAVVARCGGGGRMSPGGVPFAVAGGV